MSEQTPLKILIVDDDELDRIAIRRALAKAKKVMDIDEASEFAQATQLLRVNRYDCLLFDYRLGGRNGLELIKKIQSEGLSHAPIVMLSGLDDERVMLNCLKEGAQDFLLKSEITTNSLVRAIRYAQERKQIALQMRFLAQHDTLTGLANRSLFIDSVKRAIMQARRDNSYFALIFIDVDNFKNINDTLGHEAGDELLTTIAQRIKASIRGEDIVGRLGGDEFSVLISGVTTQSSLIKIAQQLLESIREPVILYNKTIHTSISLGIATYPTCSDEASALIKCADLAMYKAKQNGRNNYCFYSEDLQRLADEYANIKIDLQHALVRNEFELYYQPQINASDGSIAGVEALIRWHHPTRGLVPPDDFIPIAETSGLINPIGDWVIDKACLQLKTWISDYNLEHSNLTMAINMSAHQIQQIDITEKVSLVINKYKLPCPQVELELTESILIDDLERCKTKLEALSEQEIQLAIDDFGTGFSSFRHLQQLPLKILKIDKSFIDDICTARKSREIVKAMIVMARALDMAVVAEGVETEDQAILLRELGCDKLQGYYFSKPLCAHDLGQMLAHPEMIPAISDTPRPVDNKLTILLVDDDDLDAKAVERMLKKQDDPPKLERAINGLQALEMLRARSGPQIKLPYLVLLDLNMPKMGGIELLEEIRKDTKLQNSVIFVLTTSSADKDKVAAYGRHVAGYIVKSELGADYHRLSSMLNVYQKTVSLLQ